MHKKWILPLPAGTQHRGRLTCGPTKLTGMEGFVNLVNMNDSSSSYRTMFIQRPSCFFNLCSSCSSRSNKRRGDCLLSPPAAGCAAAQASPPHLTPIAGLAIPLLTHTCCYYPATADELVNPHIVVLPSAWDNCRVFPASMSFPS